MTERIDGVYSLVRAEDADAPSVAPVLLDSPHSGVTYPGDFGTVVPLSILRGMEDAYVDVLYEDAPAQGASLLRAEFPRSYIDPNRAADDLDWRLIDGSWPGVLRPTEKTRLGHGLIWRTCPGDQAMYDRLLTVAEVRHRIDSYWWPYHHTLESEQARLYSLYGAVWHINCHSMPATSSPFMPGAVGGRRADVVLGDRDGRSCDPGFTDFVKSWFETRGYRVRVNNPYKGAELVRLCGDPEYDRHSLQIEINRRLYMDERTLERGPGFERTRDLITGLIAALGDFVRRRLA